MKVINYLVLMIVSFLSLSCSKDNQLDFESFFKNNEGKYICYGEISPAPDFNGVYSESKYFKIEQGVPVKYTILSVSLPEKEIKPYRVSNGQLFVRYVDGLIETNLFDCTKTLEIDSLTDKRISLENGKYEIEVLSLSEEVSLLDKAELISLNDYNQMLKGLSSN